MNYIDEITKLQKQIDSNKLEQARLRERFENLENERKKLMKELEVYEINESNLHLEIQKLEEEIIQNLAKCQNLLK